MTGLCLVTGGAGFIGSHLVRALVEAGRPVRVLDDFSTGKRANLAEVRAGVEVIERSITDPAAVRGVERVFHLAALPSVQRSVEDPLTTHEVCATGTLRVLEGARRVGVARVVYAASSSAYGDTPGVVRTEDDPVAPLSPYTTAKLAGEHYCRCFTRVYGLETVRLRFFNIFGPRQDPSSPYSGVLPLFIGAMLAGKAPTLHGSGEQSRDFTYVANVVRALLRVAEVPGVGGKVYNVGNGGRTSVLKLVALLNELLGTKIEAVHGPARAGDVLHSQADISRARAELGYDPSVSLAEGLRRTVDSLRATEG